MPHRVKELHWITAIENIPSVLRHGILSFNKVIALNIKHKDISMEEVQSIRDKKIIPNGKNLHEYANVYFHGVTL